MAVICEDLGEILVKSAGDSSGLNFLFFLWFEFLG